MPRHPRIHAAGVLDNVMARGNNGQRMFLKSGDYETFLEVLGNVQGRRPFYLYAYVLMSDHFHLLLEVVDTSTARIILLEGVARVLPARR
jgi:putative transposase